MRLYAPQSRQPYAPGSQGIIAICHNSQSANRQRPVLAEANGKSWQNFLAAFCFQALFISPPEIAPRFSVPGRPRVYLAPARTCIARVPGVYLARSKKALNSKNGPPQRSGPTRSSYDRSNLPHVLEPRGELTPRRRPEDEAVTCRVLAVTYSNRPAVPRRLYAVTVLGAVAGLPPIGTGQISRVHPAPPFTHVSAISPSSAAVASSPDAAARRCSSISI